MLNIKKVYGIMIIFTMIAFISALVLSKVTAFESTHKAFASLLGTILLINITTYKYVFSHSEIWIPSIILMATTIISIFAYVFVTAFIAGRLYIALIR